MNIEEYRPINIDKVIGQELPKTGLLAMLKTPYTAPKIVILSGPYGTGRKTLARNYVKSRYCTELEKSGSNCGTCEICRNILTNKEVYKEIDYSQIDTLTFAKNIVITNFELCPRDKQVKLLEWFDSQDIKPTILLIAENTDNIIDNLYMLSFILRTSLLSIEEIKLSLQDYNERSGKSIPDDSIEIIARRARGHILDAHKMFENYKTLDDETFKESVKSARELLIAFLVSCYKNSREDVDKYLSRLKNIPLNYIKNDYEALIVEIMKVCTKFEKPKDKLMEILISEIKTKVLDLYYILNDKIIYNSFQNDDTFQAAMYVIYLKLNTRIR